MLDSVLFTLKENIFTHNTNRKDVHYLLTDE